MLRDSLSCIYFTLIFSSKCKAYLCFSHTMVMKVSITFISHAPVAQKVDSDIRWINLYPVDSANGFPNTYPLDSDLSSA